MVAIVLNRWVSPPNDWKIDRISRNEPEAANLISFHSQDKINCIQDEVHQHKAGLERSQKKSKRDFEDAFIEQQSDWFVMHYIEFETHLTFIIQL